MDHSKKSLRIIGMILGIFLCLLFVFIAYTRWKTADEQYQSTVQATNTVEKALTTEHGSEVSSVIENYHLQVGSFETRKNPERLSQLLTGPSLRLLQSTRSEDLEFWYIPKSVEVEGVRIIEYSSSQFKAIGCGTIYTDKVTPQGIVIESLPPREFRIIYVFTSEDNVWKLAASYNIIEPDDALREWEHTYDWAKEIIGDLSNYVYKKCDID